MWRRSCRRGRAFPPSRLESRFRCYNAHVLRRDNSPVVMLESYCRTARRKIAATKRSGETRGIGIAMAVTYFVALPFVRTEEGVAPGQAQEMPNEQAAIRRAESMSRDPANAGALAFKRSGDPNMGIFGDATILKTFGEVPENLDEL